MSQLDYTSWVTSVGKEHSQGVGTGAGIVTGTEGATTGQVIGAGSRPPGSGTGAPQDTAQSIIHDTSWNAAFDKFKLMNVTTSHIRKRLRETSKYG